MSIPDHPVSPGTTTLPGLATYGEPPAAFLGTFRTGAILAETFSVYAANFFAFLMITGVVLAPIYALMLAAVLRLDAETSTSVTGCLWLVNLLVTPIATAAIVFGVVQQMRGRDTSVGECLRVGLSQLGRVLGTAILQGIAILGGTLLCLVPGIIVAVMYAVAVPAAVEERLGARDALERSSMLTKGFRWEVFFVSLALQVLAYGLGLLVGFLPITATTGQLLVQALQDLLFTSLSATAAAVMYYRLRSVKESVDVEQIASVFD